MGSFAVICYIGFGTNVMLRGLNRFDGDASHTNREVGR